VDRGRPDEDQDGSASGSYGPGRFDAPERTYMTRQVLDIPADSELFAGSRESFRSAGYAPAVRAGGLLFISGQVARAADGSIPDDVTEQADLVFRKTVEVLRWAGLDLGDLVEMVSYHVDSTNTLSQFMAVKERYIKPPFAAWTAVPVPALGNASFKVELRSVAAFRD
jgi:enamine deaminase RidA (YjgF/YER057c/UK114 family)